MVDFMAWVAFMAFIAFMARVFMVTSMKDAKQINTITHTMRTNWKPMNIQIAFMGLVFMAGMARAQLAKAWGSTGCCS